MNARNQQQLLQTAGDPTKELPDRLNSLRQLDLSQNPPLVASLKRLLGRPRPPLEQRPENWDPQAAERVVDLHIVEALHKLGDDSELNRIAPLVKQAGDILQGPDNELFNAASVIQSIGRTEPIAALIGLTSDKDARVVRNAVRTLDQLKLPEPPVGQSIVWGPHLYEKITFTIHTLKEELEALVDLGRGAIALSPGVKEFLVRNDYDRGSVTRENVLLSEIIERDLSILEFDYFVEGDHVTICTYGEAGARWQNWWKRYGPELDFQKEKSLFFLRVRHQ